MNFKVSYKDAETAHRAQRMYELNRQHLMSIMDGKYKEAVRVRRNLAKIALEDFETYKTLPILSFKNVPLKIWLSLLSKSIKYRLYKLFTRKTPEEKEFYNLCQEYQKTLTPEDIRKKTIDINIPPLY